MESSLWCLASYGLALGCTWMPYLELLMVHCQPGKATSKTEMKAKVKITQLCPTLHDPMNYIVPGILQARILEWVAFPFSRGYSQPRDRTQVSHIAGFLPSWATREAQNRDDTCKIRARPRELESAWKFFLYGETKDTPPGMFRRRWWPNCQERVTWRKQPQLANKWVE